MGFESEIQNDKKKSKISKGQGKTSLHEIPEEDKKHVVGGFQRGQRNGKRCRIQGR